MLKEGVPAMTSEKVLIVSVDGHVAAPMEEYRPYLEEGFHEEFDEFLVRHQAIRGGSRIMPPKEFFDAAEIDPYIVYMVESGAIDAEFDAERRVKEVSREGVAVEVLFPNGVPFQEAFGDVDPRLTDAGARAYNRWIADFVSQRPERFIGQAIVNFHEVDAAVETVHWACAHGLKSVLLPAVDPALPRVHWDPALDPFWSVLEETGMTANVHGGSGLQTFVPPPGVDLRVMTRILGEEFPMMAHRPLTFMMWSGVFERHPRLRTVWTEQYSDWIPRTLRKWDWTWSKDQKFAGKMLEFVPRRPSEYWAKNCWAGMSLASKAELACRNEIGTDKVMFGVDFPHVESTYPKTLHTLQALAEGVPEEELRAFLGLNAAALWDLDVAVLQQVVEEVGFTMEELRTPPPPGTQLNDDVYRPLA
jgi:predicted TIM-barrel fold metal-dependent hydrolase